MNPTPSGSLHCPSAPRPTGGGAEAGGGPWVLWPSALCRPLGWNSPYSHRGLLQVSRLQSLRVLHRKELGQEFLQVVRPGEHLLGQLTDRSALDHPGRGGEREREKGHQRCFPTSGLNVSSLHQGVAQTPRTLSLLTGSRPRQLSVR